MAQYICPFLSYILCGTFRHNDKRVPRSTRRAVAFGRTLVFDRKQCKTITLPHHHTRMYRYQANICPRGASVTCRRLPLTISATQQLSSLRTEIEAHWLVEEAAKLITCFLCRSWRKKTREGTHRCSKSGSSGIWL